MAKGQTGQLDTHKVNPGEVKPDGFAGYGWYGMDDAGKLIIGPFATEEECQKAIEAHNG